jgi:hypothetical protein
MSCGEAVVSSPFAPGLKHKRQGPADKPGPFVPYLLAAAINSRPLCVLFLIINSQRVVGTSARTGRKEMNNRFFEIIVCTKNGVVCSVQYGRECCSVAGCKSRESAVLIACHEPEIKGKSVPLLNKHHAVKGSEDRRYITSLTLALVGGGL